MVYEKCKSWQSLCSALVFRPHNKAGLPCTIGGGGRGFDVLALR